MKRYLDFFDSTIALSIEKPLADACARGARKALVTGDEPCNGAICDLLHRYGFSWNEKKVALFQISDIANNDLVVINSGPSADVSQVLHACIGQNIAVIAPVTDYHISKRTIFLMSIPKAGTHMLIRLLTLMGLDRSSDFKPRPETWSTPIGYEYHAPCRELLANDWFDPVGRQLLFRSPAIFVYRNPLDIIVSELDWFVKTEHAFSGYLNCCTDDGERLSRLIEDETVMGNIRDRINRYAGWMNFNNVIPVSYEELVGSRGGGSDSQQSDSIWALQLKLHIAGNPEIFGNQLYNPGSSTFSQGRIGRHVERFNREHFAQLDSLPQDFMHALGYTKDSPNSSKVTELLHRPLVVKQFSIDELYTPRLVREDVMGWNIVEMAGQYFPVRQGVEITSLGEALAFYREHEGFMILSDAISAVIGQAFSECASGTVLLAEGFLGFNIVRHHGYCYGFDQATGSIDIGHLDSFAIESMKKNGTCITGESAADIKSEIMQLVMQRESRKLIQRIELHEASLRDAVQHVEDLVTLKPINDGLAIEGFLGFNIVCHGGHWYGFDQATGSIDITHLDSFAIENMKKNGTCITGESAADIKSEIMQLVMQRESRKLIQRIELHEASLRDAVRHVEDLVTLKPINDGLAIEGFLGFNIVCHGGHWYGFDQVTGSIDITLLCDSAIDDMKRREICVTGESVVDVKAEIVRLMLQLMERRCAEMSKRLTFAEDTIHAHQDAAAGAA